ncbi:EAL domain-containing protein [Selenomonas sp.]|uniref:EAL domain-containing protein n=1 Tax=Selenomonas sp. TaxID=2053611 RepID=UPI002A753786|nr:EAL domain-containing protein [Selenomonas sp.]MDY3298764.1 EAL domain-containing protein [Selenomonas sp.]
MTLDIVTMTDYEKAYAAMQDGEADFLLNMFVDPAWGAQRDLDQTAPFVVSYFTGVTRRTAMPEHPVIATLDNRLAKELIAQHFPDQRVVTYKSIQDCLDAVRHGEADVTYIRVEAAQYETMRGAYPDLVPSGRIAFARGIAMGVPTSGDPVLLRVLDKEIHHMGQSVTEAYYAEEAQKSFRDRSALSVIYTYPQRALAILAALHAMGFAIDMNDFGSGYSDLSLLNQLPLDVMKIDRSLLLASEGSERMCVVLRQMVGLGHALGMKVICEGIETTTQEELLIGCGCEYGQGYLYGKPMKRADFEAFLKEHV